MHPCRSVRLIRPNIHGKQIGPYEAPASWVGFITSRWLPWCKKSGAVPSGRSPRSIKRLWMWMGWIISPDFWQRIICSSSVTPLQFHPSDANSMLFRAAFRYSSSAEVQRRSLVLVEYSSLMGIGMTDTDSRNTTLRLFFFLPASGRGLKAVCWMQPVEKDRPDDDAKEGTIESNDACEDE